jgi:RNA polymerase II subunit A C-terminal domain phosphatase SSU72
VFDVVVCFEERVAEALLADLEARPPGGCRPVAVLNIDVKDNHEEAAKVRPLARGAGLLLLP